MLHIYHQSQKTIKQTKVIPGVVLTEVSNLIHSVIDKKQGDQIQISVEKRLKRRKRKMDSSLVNPSYQSMKCVIK